MWASATVQLWPRNRISKKDYRASIIESRKGTTVLVASTCTCIYMYNRMTTTVLTRLKAVQAVHIPFLFVVNYLII